MKIVLATADLAIRGGTHKQFLRLAQYLVGAGHDVVVLTTEYVPDKTFAEFADFDIRVVPIRTSRWRPLRRLDEILSGRRMVAAVPPGFRVINIHDNGLQFFHWALRRGREPFHIVWQINDLPGFFQLGTASRKRARPWWPISRKFQRWVARTSDLVTVNVTKNRARVREAMGINADVLYCGVDLRATALRHHPVPSGRHLRLLSVGVFLTYRNYEAILSAQKVLAEKSGITSELVIIGSRDLDPGYADSVERLAGELGVECTILGNVDEAELQRQFDRGDAFVFVNVDQSWGLAVFEAMNMGLPVIVSKSVGATELLHDGVDAAIVDPLDPEDIARALASLLDDPALYQARAQAGFDATLEMTWDKLYSRPLEERLLQCADKR